MDDAIYCSYCGRLLDGADTQEEEVSAGLEQAASLGLGQAVRHREAEKRKTSRWVWAAPVLSAVIVAASLAVYYSHEAGINAKIVTLHKQAQAAALEGKYAEASDKLEEALRLRPHFAALQADEAIVAMAAKLEHTVQAASKQLDEREIVEAEKGLDSVVDNLNNREEALFVHVRGQLEEQQERLTSLRLVEGLGELNTISDLAYALSTISGLAGAEAEAARNGLVGKIVAITDESARALLQKKKFNNAITIVNKGLEYANDNERLKELLDEIVKAKEQYEHNEQLRLEQALQKAAAEDLKNQTAAVEVVKLESRLGEEDVLLIQGELKNAATRPIYSVTVEFTVYNAAGEALGSSKAEATPEYVESGEHMYIYGELPDIHEEQTTVKIDNVTWYLD